MHDTPADKPDTPDKPDSPDAPEIIGPSQVPREIRVALVLYGGASLAVWMHGVTKEFLKIGRASKVHSNRSRGYALKDYPDEDTESVYLELLDALYGEDQRGIRLIFDVIAGASAGAINGALLGKALTCDLSLDASTPLWLEHADIELLTTPPRLLYWLRWPLVRLGRSLVPNFPKDSREAKRKFTRLLLRKWMRAPLSGRMLCEHLLDTLETMRSSRRWVGSLLPYGQTLEFMASITDVNGFQRSLGIDPAYAIEEMGHAVSYRLVHHETSAGRERSDFMDSNDPALAWAARASSSYPGAFPPFTHGELMEVLAERGLVWPKASQSVRENLYTADDRRLADLVNPEDRWYMDGGIVNNKPFSNALAALQRRPADRLVHRIVLYVEPNPQGPWQDRKLHNRWFAGIIHAASNIPRNQPVMDDLEEISKLNARARLNREIIAEHGPDIAATIREVFDRHTQDDGADNLNLGAMSAELLEIAEQQYGRAWRVYTQRRSRRLANALVAGWTRLLPGDPQRQQLVKMSEAVALLAAGNDADQMWVRFLQRYDVLYRIRRLAFTIRQINEHLIDHREVDRLSVLKRELWAVVDNLQRLYQARDLPADLVKDLNRLLEDQSQGIPFPPHAVQRLMIRLARHLNLMELDAQVDDLLAQHLAPGAISAATRLAVISRYTGFPLYDPLLTDGGDTLAGADRLSEIEVVRLSPAEHTNLTDEFKGLRSVGLYSFAGFFDRAWREHDYLWGRIHSADRLVSLLASDAPRDIPTEPFRRRLLRSIVRAERPRLRHSGELLDRLEAHLGDE